MPYISLNPTWKLSLMINSESSFYVENQTLSFNHFNPWVLSDGRNYTLGNSNSKMTGSHIQWNPYGFERLMVIT
jgi:hypothetical protein